MPKDEIEKADANYLSNEIKERVSRGPIRFTLLVQIADPGDNLNDPSIVWPDTRTKVELGTIEITKTVADNAVAERQLLFLPGTLPDGIEAEDPMINARHAAYPVSFGRRQ